MPKNTNKFYRYLGGGFLPGIPARDMTVEEAEALGISSQLEESGFYQLEKAAKDTAEKEG